MGQGRVHLLLRGLVGQVEGLGCCRCVQGGGGEASGLNATLMLLELKDKGTDPLLPAGAVGAGLDWSPDGWEDLRAAGAPPAGLGPSVLQRAVGAAGVGAGWH